MAVKGMSQSQLMADLVNFYTILQEYLLKISQSQSTAITETTTFNYLDNEGEIQNIEIPSIGYIKNDISGLKEQLESLITNNGDVITLTYKDGSVRNFEMKRISELVDILNSAKNTTYQVPTTLKYKNNWMFESFLNPLLVLPIDISQFINESNDIRKFSVRRVILNTPNASAIDYFNNYFLNKNDLDYNTALRLLSDEGIPFNLDDNEYDLPSAINAKRGNFSVTDIIKTTMTINGTTVPLIYYKLDKLYYTSVLSKDSSGYTSLNTGDILMTSDDTEYQIVDIQRDTRQVSLQRIFGVGDIQGIGDTLKIKPEAYRVPELQVNVGYNEYELIFTKPISSQLDMTVDTWTKGFGIYTNNLYINLNDGSSLQLPEYYDKYVSDFGTVLLGIAKEKQTPAAIGIKPDSPVINPENLKVNLINSHLTTTSENQDLQSEINTINSCKNTISDLNTKIKNAKSIIDSDNASVETTSNAKSTIDKLVSQKESEQSKMATALNTVATAIKGGDTSFADPKYRIQGFIDIPDPKTGVYGDQYIIQMIISYRYKSASNGSSNSGAIQQIDANGNTTTAYISQWNEVYSKIRRKTYDSEKGIYVWEDNDESDSDVININQVDIPIKKGEVVEIRAKAVSEAGYPLNPLESDWSDIVEVSFPDEYASAYQSEYLTDDLLIENALSEFNSDLIARGLNDHLSDSMWINSRYYAHSVDNIYYQSNDSIVSLGDKIKELESLINSVSADVLNTRGELSVYIIDNQTNETYVVTNSQTVEINRVRYKESNDYKHDGDIVRRKFTVKISNGTSGIIELASIFGSYKDANCPEIGSSSIENYDTELAYDYAPVNLYQNTDCESSEYKVDAPNGFEAPQKQSQFIFFRGYDLKLNSLYDDYSLEDNPETYEYDYTEGRKITGESETIVHYDDGIRYLPQPTEINSSTYAQKNVLRWDSSTESWSMDGKKNSFCISSDLPPALYEDKKGWEELNNLDSDDCAYEVGLLFSHNIGFNSTTSNTSQKRFTPVIQQVEGDGEYKKIYRYPCKTKFSEYDKYLIGNNTCGAYLYPEIKNYRHASISGDTKELEAYGSISFELDFEIRCSDYLGYIGGYNTTTLKNGNIIYTKKIGIDIYRNNTSSSSLSKFSFDVVFSGSYK